MNTTLIPKICIGVQLTVEEAQRAQELRLERKIKYKDIFLAGLEAMEEKTESAH